MALSERDFVMNTLEQVKLADAPRHDVEKAILHFCTTTIEAMKLGYEMEMWEKREMVEMILSEFKRLSLNELYYAFKLERYGKFGQPTLSYGRFDTLYVSQVLRKYKEWKQEYRKKNNLPIGKINQNSSQEISDSEKKSLLINGVLECYDHYIETYMIPTGKAYVYDLLYDMDLLPKDADSKNRAYQEAKDVIRMNLEQMDRTSFKDRNEYKNILMELESRKSDIVVREAKNIIVGKYFRKTKREKLEQILTDKI